MCFYLDIIFCWQVNGTQSNSTKMLSFSLLLTWWAFKVIKYSFQNQTVHFQNVFVIFFHWYGVVSLGYIVEPMVQKGCTLKNTISIQLNYDDYALACVWCKHILSAHFIVINKTPRNLVICAYRDVISLVALSWNIYTYCDNLKKWNTLSNSIDF